MDTWAARPGDITVEELMAGLASVAKVADGLTVTGGEPFDQEDALLALLRAWRSEAPGDVLVFSGHPLERLAFRLPVFDGLIDCLVADPFVASAGQTRALRGSDNQRLVCLTQRGQARFACYERNLDDADRALDVLFDDRTGEVFMAGIPRPGDMRRLAAALGKDGHNVAVTEDVRGMPC
jgi:anaerobic ribonucleoside-triphosphate reductase activating protein